MSDDSARSSRDSAPQASHELIAALQKRLERERRARREAETIAETVTRELYALNQMKEAFLATVSHELRTPLTAILGFSALLEKADFRSNYHLAAESIAAITRNAERLQALVDQILATTLFQSPQNAVMIDSFDFADVVSDVLNEVNLGKVTVDLDVTPSLRILSDRGMVATILTNLVNNAVKFSPEGGRCTIGAKTEGSSLRFWVMDQGIGIGDDALPHIFEPFWQADGSLTRQFGGVGLGLHVARLLSHILGGEITVDSPPEGGSRFVVSVRMGIAPAQESGTG